MTNFNKMLLVAGATMLFATPALAGPGSSSAQTASATTKAQIVEPLTIVNAGDLDFGTIVKTASLAVGSTYTLTLDDTGVLSGCTSPALLCTGTTSASAFTVTGTANQAVFVYTNATETMTGPGTATLVFTPNQAVPNATLDVNGTVTFGVGGSIDVTKATAPGTYNGNMDVTVDYN